MTGKGRRGPGCVWSSLPGREQVSPGCGQVKWVAGVGGDHRRLRASSLQRSSICATSSSGGERTHGLQAALGVGVGRKERIDQTAYLAVTGSLRFQSELPKMALVGRRGLSQLVNNPHRVFPGSRAPSPELCNRKQEVSSSVLPRAVEKWREAERTDTPEQDSGAR